VAAPGVGGIIDDRQYRLFQFRQNHCTITLETLPQWWYLI
jgi:hypothetical protein